MQKRKNFIHINEEFICKNCGGKVQKQGTSCRNHCNHCLYSFHVDENVPGDRKSGCQSLMKPENVDQDRKKGFIITHKCQKCNKIIRNMVASDDNQTELILLMQSAHVLHNRKTG